MLNLRVMNMTSPRTNTPVANQFSIWTNQGWFFQSYNSVIAFVPHKSSDTNIPDETKTVLDETYWDYSKTTMKYLARFLRTDAKTIRKNVKAGLYKLTDLND